MRRPVRKVLVVQPYGIGDLLFLTPVLRALRLVPSVERVDLILGSRTETMVENNPHVDRIRVVDKDLLRRQRQLKTCRDVLALGRELAREHYDTLLDYSGGEFAFLGFLLGIPVRAGYGRGRRRIFYTHRLAIPHGFEGRHVVEYVCELAERAGVPVETRELEYYPTAGERAEAARFLASKGVTGEFAVISPGGGESWGKDAHFKRWPPRFFAEFARGVRGRAGYEAAVILGSTPERALGDEIARESGFPCVNLAGEIGLRLAAAVTEKAALFIGNDGGLMHLARSLRVPLVAFFGPVDPGVYGPYPAHPRALALVREDLECRPCYKRFRYKSDCPHRACLQEFTPDAALRKVEAAGFFNLIPAR